MRYCTKCGASNDDFAQFLPAVRRSWDQCLVISLCSPVNQQAMTDWKGAWRGQEDGRRHLRILLGSLESIKFILGYTTEGVIMLLVSVLSCGLLAVVPHVIESSGNNLSH